MSMDNFYIDITDLDQNNIDALIVALVRSGYSVYRDYEFQSIIFQGWPDEVCPELLNKLEEKDV